MCWLSRTCVLSPASGCRLMHHTVSAVLKAFVPGEAMQASAEPDAALATAHRDALARLGGSCELQHHVLRYLAGLLAAAPASLKFLRWAGLWELLYGEQFFQQGLSRPQQASGGMAIMLKLLYCGKITFWQGLQPQQWALGRAKIMPMPPSYAALCTWSLATSAGVEMLRHLCLPQAHQYIVLESRSEVQRVLPQTGPCPATFSGPRLSCACTAPSC